MNETHTALARDYLFSPGDRVRLLRNNDDKETALNLLYHHVEVGAIGTVEMRCRDVYQYVVLFECGPLTIRLAPLEKNLQALA